MSGQDCDGAWGQAPIRSLLALPRALLAPPRIESTDQTEGMMPVSERVRPEPRWPGIHHRSLRSSTEGFDLVRSKRYRVSTASLIVVCRITSRYCYACRRTILPQTGARRLLRQAQYSTVQSSPVQSSPAHRCLLLQGGGLGLLLHGHRHGRLLPLHSGPQASEGYHIRLLHSVTAGDKLTQ